MGFFLSGCLEVFPVDLGYEALSKKEYGVLFNEVYRLSH